MSAPRRIPQQRLAAIAIVATATKEGPVLVPCRSAGVRRQYRRGVCRHSGIVENLHLLSSDEGAS